MCKKRVESVWKVRAPQNPSGFWGIFIYMAVRCWGIFEIFLEKCRFLLEERGKIYLRSLAFFRLICYTIYGKVYFYKECFVCLRLPLKN